MGKNKFKPKIEADERVEFDGAEEPEKFTNFEELQKKVEILQEIIDEHALILRQNNLEKVEKTEAPYFDDDEVFKRLEED